MDSFHFSLENTVLFEFWKTTDNVFFMFSLLAVATIGIAYEWLEILVRRCSSNTKYEFFCE